MKVRTGNRIQKATREFTDREEPRASFWKAYAAVKAELSGECNVHVLSYYGIGGIGKTRLLKKLIEEMDEQLADPVYAYIDFDISQESRRTLARLKNKLEERGKFTFPLFDLGLYVYAKKAGEKADSPEVQQLTQKSPFLSLMMSIAGNIPVVGVATQALSLADQSVTFLRNYLKMHSRELAAIEYMEPDALYKHLPKLFALDMANNMSTAKAPVVILLDTYERLVNELSQIGEPLKNDEWIRGEEGLIQNIPGVLWVIAGREKLKWVQFDPDWEGALEQHILGNLSKTDSVNFLEKAGVGGAELREGLYQLTQGTPVYLDLCVDQFTRMVEKGTVPDISMFGQDTYDLIERFVRYMGDTQKDHIYLLACLRTWSDGLILEIARQVLPNFSLTAYEKTKDFSFVIQSDDGEYNIHQTVGQVLMDHCPQTIRIPTGNALIQRFSTAVGQQPVLSAEYADALQYMTLGSLLVYTDREELCTFFVQQLRDPVKELLFAGRLEQGKPILNALIDRANDAPADRFFGEVLYMQSVFSNAAGDYDTEKKQAEAILRLFSKLLGEDHLDTINALNHLAVSLKLMGENEKALEMQQTVLDKRRKFLGEDHPDTLSAMNNLANAWRKLGEYQKALELGQAVLERRRGTLGDDHPKTLIAMANLAITLKELGENQKALELEQTVLRKRRIVRGEDHPDTLSAMYNLAITLGELGELQKELELEQAVLEKRRRLLGEDHPDTLSAMVSLAITMGELKEYQKASELEQAVLEKRRRLLGEDHPKTIGAMVNLAITMGELKEYQKALELEQAVLDKKRRLLGEDHPDTLSAMINLAITWWKLEEYQKAQELEQIVLDKRRRILGEDHPDTIGAMGNLANTWWKLGEYQKAQELEQTVLEKRRRLLGEDHPDTIQAMRNLAITLNAMRNTEEAQQLWDQANTLERKRSDSIL